MERKELWQKIGWMKSGEAIYCSENYDLAIEKDYEFLVEPSEYELKELKNNV